MDIKREFEPSLHSSTMLQFYNSLKDNKAFKSFNSLDHFLQFMENRSSASAQNKDACLLAIISQIQRLGVSQSGLCLLTYILAPGLQNILRDLVCKGNIITEAWSDLWWHFLQRTQNYPTLRRPSKVAANLLLDTRHSLMDALKAENIYHRKLSSVDEFEYESEPTETHLYRERASLLISGKDPMELSKIDSTLILGSRVYGEKLKDVANRLGITYGAARARRSRAERKLRADWVKLEKQNEKNKK
ncbi:hypothetical protein H8D57_03500 [bacterium]|nr:hypothetical protein [bacterium]